MKTLTTYRLAHFLLGATLFFFGIKDIDGAALVSCLRGGWLLIGRSAGRALHRYGPREAGHAAVRELAGRLCA